MTHRPEGGRILSSGLPSPGPSPKGSTHNRVEAAGRHELFRRSCRPDNIVIQIRRLNFLERSPEPSTGKPL